MKLKLILCLCMLPLFCLAQEAQPQQFSNRYGMKMTQNEDGSYALLYAKKYAKFIDVNTIPDVMVPYTYQPDRLKSKDYKGVATKDIVYKKHKDYELILTVDFAETDKPAPFVVYIHGGGWARGDNGSSRSLSQYLAKQKGITGVRVSYTRAGACCRIECKSCLCRLSGYFCRCTLGGSCCHDCSRNESTCWLFRYL